MSGWRWTTGDGIFHWRKCYYGLWTHILAGSNSLTLKTSWWICLFCLLKMLTDGLEWCGLLVDYCDVFISCLDSHSDGTHSLQSIHCWDSDVMLHFSKSDEETNSSTSWMTWGWEHFQQCFTVRKKKKKLNGPEIGCIFVFFCVLKYDIDIFSWNTLLVL